MPTRRAALLLPLLAAACGGQQEPAYVPPGPMRFNHLTPLPLNVADVEVPDAAPPPQPGDIGGRIAPSPAEAVRIMGRDRLLAVGTSGQARFAVTQAALVQGRDSLTCLVGCRLEIVSADGQRMGFADAQARSEVRGTDAIRPRAAEALLRQAMELLNVEFEYQLRQKLRDWLMPVSAGPDGTLPPPPAPGGVTEEELPRR